MPGHLIFSRFFSLGWFTLSLLEATSYQIIVRSCENLQPTLAVQLKSWHWFRFNPKGSIHNDSPNEIEHGQALHIQDVVIVSINQNVQISKLFSRQWPFLLVRMLLIWLLSMLYNVYLVEALVALASSSLRCLRCLGCCCCSKLVILGWET